MRRLPVLCAGAVIVLGAFAIAQKNVAATAGTIITSNGSKAIVVAEGLAVRALAVGSSGNGANGTIYVTNSTAPNQVFALQGVTLTNSGLPAAVVPGAAANTVALPKSAALALVAGVGQAGSLGDGGAAVSAQLDLDESSLAQRSGLAVAPGGTIFIADTGNSTIRSIAGSSSTEPDVIRSVAGRWAARQSAALIAPMGIAADSAGNLYIADSGAQSGANNSASNSGANGSASGAILSISGATGELTTLAQVESPASIAVTPDGSKIFVASPATGEVIAITTATHSVAQVPGFSAAADAQAASPCASLTSGAASTSAGRASAAGTKVCPAGLAADAQGNLFVADANSGNILRVDALTSRMTVVASGLSEPGEIALDGKGNLYVAEQGLSRLVVLPQVTGSSGSITLTVPAAFAAPCPQVTNPYTYCNEPTGGTSRTAVFTLANTSASAINSVVISVTTTDFTVQGKSCSATLAANSSCTITVAFTPQATGARTGTLTVTDANPGDSATQDLAGNGNDYTLQLPSTQTTELTVTQGGTATFMAQVVPVGTFGANGEKVTFVCPANLPSNTSCAITPCPLSITAGTTATFQIVFVTSSATSVAPVPTAGCSSYGPPPSGMLVPGSGPRNAPGGGPQVAGGLPFLRAWRFPAPLSAVLLISAALLAGIFAAAAAFLGKRKAEATTARRVPIVFAAVGIAAAIVAGCHHKANTTIVGPATSIGITNMIIQGTALDASGNPLNASRPLTSIALDVIAAP